MAEVTTTGWSQEGSNWTSGEDPLEQPNLSLPEVPGEELVCSSNIGCGEAVSSHEPANSGSEYLLEPTRFSHPEKLVHGVLDPFDEVNLSDGTSNSMTDASSLTENPVPQRFGDRYDFATNSLDNSDSTMANPFDASSDISRSSVNIPSNRSCCSTNFTANISGSFTESSPDLLEELGVGLNHLGIFEESVDSLLIFVDLSGELSKVLVDLWTGHELSFLLERRNLTYLSEQILSSLVILLLRLFGKSFLLPVLKWFGLKLKVVLWHFGELVCSHFDSRIQSESSRDCS